MNVSEEETGLTLDDYDTTAVCFQGNPDITNLTFTDTADRLQVSTIFVDVGLPDEGAPVECTITNTRIGGDAEPGDEEPGDTVVDTDYDGLSDADEYHHGTDSLNPDTDGDGVTDGRELFIDGTDPLDPYNGQHPLACPRLGTFDSPLTGSLQLAQYGGGSFSHLAGVLNEIGAGRVSFGPPGDLRTVEAGSNGFTVGSLLNVFSGVEVDLANPANVDIAPCTLLFIDGFESGDTTAFGQ